MQAAQPLGLVEGGVQQDAVDDEPHEQRLDHLEPRHHQREEEHQRDAAAMRPEPADVLAEVLAALAAAPTGLRGGLGLGRWRGRVRLLFLRLLAAVGVVIQPAMPIVLHEIAIALPRGPARPDRCG